MADRTRPGIPGMDIQPGDHICALYAGLEQRDEVLIPYLREGLRRDEKCIAVVDHEVPRVLAGVGEALGVDRALATRQLEVLASSDTYLRGGRFSGAVMLAFWDQAVGDAVANDGYPFVRVCGEATSLVLDLDGGDAWLRYEDSLNRFATRHPQAVVCLYDLDVFGGGLLLDLIRTHPKLLVRGAVVENPYFIPPEELLEGGGGS